MSRRTHSLNTRRIVFKKAEETDVSNIRIDRHGRKIKFDDHGISSSEYGWNIHHRDFDSKNNSISNLEAINYITHKEVHHEEW